MPIFRLYCARGSSVSAPYYRLMTDERRWLSGLTRRDYLRATGSIGLLGAVAGCSGSGALEGEESVRFGYGGDALQVMTAASASVSDTTTLAPVARWALDEACGDTAHDIAGDNDGTFYGSPGLGLDGVRGAGSVDFRATDGHYAEIPDAPALRPGPEIGFGGWYRTASGDTNQTVLQKADALNGGAGYSIEVQTESGVRAHVGTENGEVSVKSFGHATHDGAWHHLFAVWDTETLRLYLDGEEVARSRGSGSVVHSGNDLFIARGHNRWSSRYDMAGALDDVRVYDAALSAAAVSALYEGSEETTTTTPTTTEQTTTTSEPTTTADPTSPTTTSEPTTATTTTTTTTPQTTTTTTSTDNYGQAGYGAYGYGGTLDN